MGITDNTRETLKRLLRQALVEAQRHDLFWELDDLERAAEELDLNID